MTPQLSDDILEFLNRDTTREFLVIAKRFVDLLEDRIISKEDFLRLSHSILIELYSAGYKLNEIELRYSSADSDFDRSELFDNQKCWTN